MLLGKITDHRAKNLMGFLCMIPPGRRDLSPGKAIPLGFAIPRVSAQARA